MQLQLWQRVHGLHRSFYYALPTVNTHTNRHDTRQQRGQSHANVSDTGSAKNRRGDGRLVAEIENNKNPGRSTTTTTTTTATTNNTIPPATIMTTCGRGKTQRLESNEREDDRRENDNKGSFGLRFHEETSAAGTTGADSLGRVATNSRQRRSSSFGSSTSSERGAGFALLAAAEAAAGTKTGSAAEEKKSGGGYNEEKEEEFLGEEGHGEEQADQRRQERREEEKTDTKTRPTRDSW